MSDKKNTKDQILDVVEGLCATIGPQRLQHATIAAKLGIKPPSLYAHFPSMQAILEAVTLRALTAILATYEDLNESLSAKSALDLCQSRQVDLLLLRPGIARLVLTDLSQPGGAEAIGWYTTEIVKITTIERGLFERAVADGQIEDCDFFLWFSSRMGALYVSMSYEWLRCGEIGEKRADLLKKVLASLSN